MIHTTQKGATMPKYRVQGHSGQTEIISAANPVAANKDFVDHHGEPALKTDLVVEITEEDTARG